MLEQFRRRGCGFVGSSVTSIARGPGIYSSHNLFLSLANGQAVEVIPFDLVFLLVGDQCDQVWRDFATLAKCSKSLAIF